MLQDQDQDGEFRSRVVSTPRPRSRRLQDCYIESQSLLTHRPSCLIRCDFLLVFYNQYNDLSRCWQRTSSVLPHTPVACGQDRDDLQRLLWRRPAETRSSTTRRVERVQLTVVARLWQQQPRQSSKGWNLGTFEHVSMTTLLVIWEKRSPRPQLMTGKELFCSKEFRC